MIKLEIQRVNRIEKKFLNHVCRACAERVNILRIIISPVPTIRESILSMQYSSKRLVVACDVRVN